jgi:hypothetical protein
MRTHLNHLIIALAVIIAAALFSNAFVNRNRKSDTISVTGLGSKDFVSDLIVWSGSFNRKSLTMKEAYSAIDTDREKIRNYLTSKGLKPEEIIFYAINISQQYNDVYNDEGRRINSEFTGYLLSQQVKVESRDVNKVENISREVSELINSGVEFYSNSPQYYYTKLAELKVQMIAEATKDACTRAQKIAENAGGTVGNLKSANMGVFQIVAQNSSEEYSYGGSFNTEAKNKTATITMRLEYNVD